VSESLDKSILDYTTRDNKLKFNYAILHHNTSTNISFSVQLMTDSMNEQSINILITSRHDDYFYILQIQIQIQIQIQNKFIYHTIAIDSLIPSILLTLVSFYPIYLILIISNFALIGV
jgi:hypothetical protein